jgi:serine phosphatase RsbU (regulator of sigma subunit)
MKFTQLIVTLLFLSSSVSIFADETEELRKQLPKASDTERLEIYTKIYFLSLETDNVDYQLRCVNDMIAEAHRQGLKKDEGDNRVQKMNFFYNNDFNDSIYEQVPPLLEFLRDIKEWKNYYETWSLLVDTYTFSGQNNTALKEVKEMYDDALERDDRFGMGLAYYSMGNVYANMYNTDQAADSYQKSINLLMRLDKKPLQLSDIFAYYVDILDIQKNYERIDIICNQWSEFLTEYYEDKDKEGEAANRWAYYYQARAQAALGQDKLEMAAVMLDEMKKRCYNDESLLNRMWLYYRAELCKKQGFYDEALALNDQRMRLLFDSDDKGIQIRVRKQRAEICEAMGRYREAAMMYNEMYVINDSINVHDTKRQLTEMNTLFHVDELKMQQAEEKARLEMKQARQRQLGIIIISLIIFVALSIFIYFRLRSAKRLKIAHDKLEVAHEELKEAYDQLEETTAQKERMASELRIARDIQMSMVPSVFPEYEGLDMYASMTPAKEVGGDLYGYVLSEEEDNLYFALGDVSGKGVPASLFMAQATRLFRTLAAQNMEPAEICTRMNNALSGEDNANSMFVTLFLGLINLRTGHMKFCNAGHNPPVLGTEFIEMIPNTPIGLWPDFEFEGEEIESVKGLQLFIYTDGLNEAENQEQEQFGDDQLLEILRTTPYESAKQTIEMLTEKVEKHRNGAEPNDDLTMMCLRIS